MAAMTSTFLGSAVAVKAPVVVSSKKAVAPVASLDGLKKVRAARIDSILFHGENVPCQIDRGRENLSASRPASERAGRARDRRERDAPMRARARSSPARVFRLDRASSSLARRPARPSRVATSPDY